jgi:hypothetical protein
MLLRASPDFVILSQSKTTGCDSHGTSLRYLREKAGQRQQYQSCPQPDATALAAEPSEREGQGRWPHKTDEGLCCVSEIEPRPESRLTESDSISDLASIEAITRPWMAFLFPPRPGHRREPVD